MKSTIRRSISTWKYLFKRSFCLVPKPGESGVSLVTCAHTCKIFSNKFSRLCFSCWIPDLTQHSSNRGWLSQLVYLGTRYIILSSWNKPDIEALMALQFRAFIAFTAICLCTTWMCVCAWCLQETGQEAKSPWTPLVLTWIIWSLTRTASCERSQWRSLPKLCLEAHIFSKKI